MDSSLIDIETQKEIVEYFKRVDSTKPSSFYKNFFKEWHQLAHIRDLLLRPKKAGKNSNINEFTVSYNF